MFTRMRITRANGDGRMPWSPTVVNIERMKHRRGKRNLIIGLGAALVLMFGCVVCGAKVLPKSKSAAAHAAPTATPAPVVRYATPIAGWTPNPNNPWMVYKVETR